MRLSILLVIAWVIWPAVVLGKPRVAVAPLDGDADGKVSAIVHEAAAIHAKVTSAKTVAKALKELSIKDPDNARAAKRLRKHLGVDAVIYGKVERDGTKKNLKLSVYTRGKKPDRFEIEYSKSSSKSFREQLRDELATRLAPEENTQDDADETASANKHADEPTTEAPHNTLTQASLFADAGVGGVHRSLNYVANMNGTKPPPVGTGAFSFQIDAEIYPGALEAMDGPAAAIAVFGSFNSAVGLSIAIPGATQSAPIDETSFALGARYRFLFGESSFAAGLGYWSQSFIADRSGLTSSTQLNMADTTYKGIGPDCAHADGCVGPASGPAADVHQRPDHRRELLRRRLDRCVRRAGRRRCRARSALRGAFRRVFQPGKPDVPSRQPELCDRSNDRSERRVRGDVLTPSEWGRSSRSAHAWRRELG